MQPILFITGTDTGVGKTLLTALLTRHMRGQGMDVAAFKPICSGGRADALALHAALGGTLTLDEVNPWHFRAPIAPVLAARREKRSIKLSAVLAHLRTVGRGHAITLVEGAGGLLSPLGENFNSLDLITALRATPIIVAPNRLGVINHLLLTLKALPAPLLKKAQIVLMSPPKPDSATPKNAELLTEFFPKKQIFQLPWLGRKVEVERAFRIGKIMRVLKEVVKQ